MSRRVRKSSGNVFADLGVKDPEEALVKARLAPHAKITTPSPWGEGQGEGISCRSGSNPR